MKLICEVVENVSPLIEESVNGKKSYFVEGIFMQAEKPNRNRRIYPAKVLEEEVDRYITEFVQANRAYGELGHPEKPQLNLDRVSHIITEINKDGNNYYGKAKITNTPNGQIVIGILEAGGQLGMSSRGLGAMRKKGVLQEVYQYRLVTAGDIVSDPSAVDAWVTGIMENVNWVYKNGVWVEEELELAKADLHKTSKSEFEAKALTLFESFMSKL